MDFQRVPACRADAQATAQLSLAQVQFAFERQPFGLREVDGFLAQQDPDALALGDRNPGIGVAGESGQALVVVDGVLLERRRQETAVTGALLFLETTAHAQAAIGQREQGFVAGAAARIERRLAQTPGIVRHGHAGGVHRRPVLPLAHVRFLHSPCRPGTVRRHARDSLLSMSSYR